MPRTGYLLRDVQVFFLLLLFLWYEVFFVRDVLKVYERLLSAEQPDAAGTWIG